MPKRSSKPTDLNALAAAIVDQATTYDPVQQPSPGEEKNPHAVALGRMGGQKGGKARASKLTPERRSAIAKQAAVARWSAKERDE